MTGIDLSIVVVYLIGIMAIGILVGYRKKTSSEQFFLAGRSLRWPMIGAALFTANISTIHLVGLAADGFRIGLVVGNFEWMAAVTIILLSLIFVPYYIKAGISTLPEFVEKRYNGTCRIIMAFVTIASALLIHIGVSMYAGAKVFEYFFDIPLLLSVVVIGVVTAIYTTLGGLRAIVVTDTIQAAVLLTGCVLLTALGVIQLGEIGIHSLDDLRVAAKPDQLSMVHPVKTAIGTNNEYSWLTVMVGYYVLGIWYWCTDQTIVQKVLGAKTLRDAQLGALFASALKLLPLFFMVLPGVIAYVLFSEQITDPNDTLNVLIDNLLPIGLKGLFAAGLLAAVMSTVESALNSIATLTSEDIVARLRPEVSDRSLVLIGRITAWIVIVLAMLWSPFAGQFESIFVAINKIPLLFAPAVTCIFLMGVLWARGTHQAALTTLIVGFAIGLPYFLLDMPRSIPVADIQHLVSSGHVEVDRIVDANVVNYRMISDGWDLPFMMVGMILFAICFSVYVVVSLMTPAPQNDIQKLQLDSPFKAIFSRPLEGRGDPRVFAGLLIVLIVSLYVVFR